MEEIITQKYLKSLCWVQDKTCPDGVNRWENKYSSDVKTNEWWISITFKDEKGTIPDYGVMNFYDSRRDIIIHRSFERDKEKNRTKINYAHLHQKYILGPMTVEELEKMMNNDYK